LGSPPNKKAPAQSNKAGKKAEDKEKKASGKAAKNNKKNPAEDDLVKVG